MPNGELEANAKRHGGLSKTTYQISSILYLNPDNGVIVNTNKNY